MLPPGKVSDGGFVGDRGERVGVVSGDVGSESSWSGDLESSGEGGWGDESSIVTKRKMCLCFLDL